MKIHRDNNGITVTQEKYINEVLETFQMKDCKAAQTPIVKGRVPQENEKKLFKNKLLYMSLVGSLTYLSTISRPDISYAVSKAGQKMSNPTEEGL